MRTSYAIGLLYSTTGPYGAIGRDALDGALMALDEVNADPGFGFALTPFAANPEGVIDRYHALCEAAIRVHAQRFSRARFGDEMAALITEPAAW